MRTIRFEEGLSAMLRDAENPLILLALAERAGLARRAHDVLRKRAETTPGQTISFDWFGRRSLAEVTSFWQTLGGGEARDIADAVVAWVPDDDPTRLGLAFDSLVDALTMLERAPVLSVLHHELLERGIASITENAALALGQSGDWERALGVLERAHEGGASPHINQVSQSLLWKFAYLQGEVETVLPRLAAIPFNRELPHSAEGRVWRLMAYQIRSGRADVVVPVIPHPQPHGYLEAAAMQIAALEEVASAADDVRALSDVLEPKVTTMHFVDRGTSVNFSHLPNELFQARVRVAARRKDYSKLSALARMPSRHLMGFTSDAVIDALLEEGDWRAASAIADEHDVRDHPVVEGFDDTRTDEYLLLREILAAAAARSGDDAAASMYLSEYVEVKSSTPQREYLDSDDDEDGIPELVVSRPPSSDPERAWRWLATLLAGAAEGAVPRRFLTMLLPAFRGAY